MSVTQVNPDNFLSNTQSATINTLLDRLAVLTLFKQHDLRVWSVKGKYDVRKQARGEPKSQW